MSDLRINIRFLFWHLQVKRETWKVNLTFNNWAWANWKESLSKPIACYEWDLK